MPIALFLYHFTEKLAYLFYYQDFQENQRNLLCSTLLRLACSCNFDMRFTFEKYGSIILSAERVNSGHLKYLTLTKITQGCIGQSLL